MTNSKKKPNLSPPNRNWIRPPNTIIKKGTVSNSPQKLSYWTDSKNKPQLYTKKQLATCNILMNLNFLLVRSLVLMDILKTMDKDAKIGDLVNQDYVKFEASPDSIFNSFISLMAAVPDVTFAEFLNFISANNINNNNPQEIIALGQKIIKDVIDGKNDQITNFYISDRFRKS